MKRLLVGVLAVGLLGAGVGSAIGQGTGGTVGAGATGVKTFDIKFGSVGCGSIPLKKCFGKVRPGMIFAGNGTVSQNGAKVGNVVFADIVGKPIHKGTIDTFTATIYFSNGVDTLTVAGASRDPGKALPYSVTGGTGTYAGARGTARDTKSTNNGLTAEVTFIP